LGDLIEALSKHTDSAPLYDRVPISGIRESYCPANGPRTVVMPLLILSLLAALAIFYFKGKEDPTLDRRAVAASPAPVTVEPLASTAMASAEFVSLPSPGSVTETHEPPILTRTDVGEKDFTPWMSSPALESYFRQKNGGYKGSFWGRGNWIRAIEGRWHEGAKEFRIALGLMSRPGELQWQYRLDMTEISFAEELAKAGEKGFILAQSQAYRHPDGTRRYQAVWQQTVEAKVAKR
jgi:hypothetical protein